MIRSRAIWKCAAFARSVSLGGLIAWCAAAAAQEMPVPATNNAEADKAWRETFKATQSPMPPKEWADPDHKPSPQEVIDFYVTAAVKGADKAKDFYTRYPNHPKAAQAHKAEYNLIAIAVEHFGDTNDAPRLAELRQQRLSDPGLSDDERFTIRLDAVKGLLNQRPPDLDKFLQDARTLQKDFPQRTEVYPLLLMAASSADGETARKIAQEIVDSSAPDDAKEQARGLLNKLDALGKPVDIQFTAVDGRPVDLAKMKGKVVLIDFWATWCGPCVGEVPNVKAAYDKLHDQGFEIVGISLDDNRDALTGFVKDHGMTWPQYFDGLQWANKIARKFGINSIPAMWLVDKQGNLRDQDARGALEEKVSKLLAEKPAVAP
jgi:thiol-disulfide isomerase/thioredoxin